MIEPTDEMRQAVAAQLPMAWRQMYDAHSMLNAIAAAVLAIAERDQSDASGLIRGAYAARRIADRYGEKGEDRTRADWRMWTAMSAGARAVAVRLTELADAEERP